MSRFKSGFFLILLAYFCSGAVLLRREWNVYPPTITNFPSNYPHTNSPLILNRVYRVYPNGTKELFLGNVGRDFVVEVASTNEPWILLSTNISPYIIPHIEPSREIIAFTLEAGSPTWVTNCHWQDYGWLACLSGVFSSQEVDLISFPSLKLEIPPGNFIIEWTSDFILWFPVEVITGPTIKNIDIDPRVNYRFYRRTQI